MTVGRRVVILGLDGGTWDVLDRFIEAGLMPNLARLVERGHDAVLTSTDPPITPVAWSSFATGMDPGRHGVFGFLSPRDDPGSYSPPPARSTTVRQPTLWRRASDAGLRTVVLSVPLTYPAEPVNGYMVTGMFTPGRGPGCTHPEGLSERLQAAGALPKFQLDFTRRRERGRGDAELRRALAGDAEEYFRDLDETQDLLLGAARYLTREPWDLLVAVMIGTDRLQHVMWDRVAAYESDPESAVSRRIASFYRRTDAAIGEFAGMAGEDGNLVIMSDHGFGPCAGRFAVGRWLVEQGYSVYRPRRAYGVARRIVRRLGLRRVVRRTLGSRASSSAVRSQFVPLDWERTRAYFMSGTYGVRANLCGRESHGIVEPGGEFDALIDELRERLLDAVDPTCGERVFADARRSSDVYRGAESSWAPDLVLEPNPKMGYALIAGDLGRPGLVLPSAKSRGSHRPEGMLLISGRSVRPSERRSTASIVDVAPTVMRLLGVPASSGMDGRVLSEAFDRMPEEVVRLEVGRKARGESGEARGYEESEEEAVREHLRNLGYID